MKSIIFTGRNTLIFSPAVESFGIQVIPECIKNKLIATQSLKSNNHRIRNTPTSLVDLPLEILIEIVEYLDSFSICNLAVTSVYLRQVCCSLLDAKGCVALQWERNRQKWSVAYKRWFFSTSIGPVENWTFAKSEAAISEHMKNCPYNVKTKHVDAKKLDKKWPEVMQSLRDKLSKRQLR